jgi:hypothetical protein
VEEIRRYNKMGNKLLWLGLTLVEAADFVPTAYPAVKLVGVV